MVYVRRFFWGGDSHERHIHWKSWEKLTDPKVHGGLGFRDLEAFNKALLAKQGWRLLMNPGSFWGKVIKGLYFPRSNFLIAKRGSRPSWLCSSLLHGRDLLLHGVRWQVGNGRSISFWTQNWVPLNEDFYIHSPLGPFPNCSKVSDFIVNGAWNARMLRKCVSKREADIISEIPISQTGSSDQLVWHYDAKGQYTVKSGYKQALLLKRSEASKADSSSKPPQKFWKNLWNIHTQPKIKLFAWKSITNSVATMENLFNRSCSPCPKCQICNISVETIEHLLFECAWTRPVWFGSSLCFRNHPSGTSVSLRFQRFADICKSTSEASRMLSIVATICWFIWRSRCAFVYDKVDLSPERTLASINALLNEFDNMMASNLIAKADCPNSTSQTSLRWIPPPPHSSQVKINCDAAFMDSKGVFAVVARDSSGSLLYVDDMPCSSMSPLHAEVLAVHYACHLAFRRGWSHAIVESDCQTAITLSYTETIPLWSLATLVADIRSWSKNLQISFSWTKRENNKVAHWAARFASSSVLPFRWDVSFPCELSSLSRSDMYGS